MEPVAQEIQLAEVADLERLAILHVTGILGHEFGPLQWSLHA